MKKIVLMYFGMILAIIAICIVMSLGGEKTSTFDLPDKINVYFKDEDEVREVDFEEYITFVVAAEVPASFHEEAIKAQSVAARTYIYNKYKYKNINSASKEHKGAVVCTDSTHCCAFSDREQLREIHGDEWMKEYFGKIVSCVKSTEGEIVLYEGEPIVAAFHASSGGGRTENSGEIWSDEIPYLVSVESADENTREGYYSVVEITCEDFKKIINEKFPDAKLDDDYNTWFGAVSYTEGNSVKNVKIGKAVVSGGQMRSIFGLKSQCFEINMLDDKITFKVQGSGHGVGMSQYGANFMANKGKDYTEILKWYYTGIEIDK